MEKADEAKRNSQAQFVTEGNKQDGVGTVMLLPGFE